MSSANSVSFIIYSFVGAAVATLSGVGSE